MNNRIRYRSIKAFQNNNTYKMYLHIYTLTNNFMKHNPPCKQCLIQVMCIKENLAHPTLDSEPDHLYIKLCDKLKQFIYDNNLFYRSWKN